jgi:hypothetical protein
MTRIDKILLWRITLVLKGLSRKEHCVIVLQRFEMWQTPRYPSYSNFEGKSSISQWSVYMNQRCHPISKVNIFETRS